MTRILRANMAKDKAPHLVAVVESVEQVNLMLRLSVNHRLITTKRYAAAVAPSQLEASREVE